MDVSNLHLFCSRSVNEAHGVLGTDIDRTSVIQKKGWKPSLGGKAKEGGSLAPAARAYVCCLSPAPVGWEFCTSSCNGV